MTEKYHICLKPSTLSALVVELSREHSKKKAVGEISTQHIEEVDTLEELAGGLIEASEEGQPVEEGVFRGVSESEEKTITVAFKAPHDLTEMPEVQQRPGLIGPS